MGPAAGSPRGGRRPLRLDGAPLAGRRVTVLGLGLLGGGVEVVRALAAEGAEVTASDRRDARALAPSVEALTGVPVRLALGGHERRDLERAEIVFANPAVPPDAPELHMARAAGARISSETELFLENTRGRVALVTGTHGKSTTSHLTASLLEAAGRKVHLGGNIGRSLVGALAQIEAGEAVVLEVSSYQLEALPRDVARLASPVAAGCVTNVLIDHLERHGSPEAYETAKRRLVDLVPPGAPLLLPGEDERVRGWDVSGREVLRFSPADREAELHVEGGAFRLRGEPLARVADLHLPGAFQRSNALAALGLAHLLGAPAADLSKALGACRGLPHRLESLGLRGGHQVWDNGVSTTPDSTASAVVALAERGEAVTLLVGGQAKALPLASLLAAAGRVRRVVTFGHSGAELARAFRAEGARVLECGGLEEAVRTAYRHMQAGEALLFSPACASFDAHLNFMDRAAAFRAALPD